MTIFCFFFWFYWFFFFKKLCVNVHPIISCILIFHRKLGTFWSKNLKYFLWKVHHSWPLKKFQNLNTLLSKLRSSKDHMGVYFIFFDRMNIISPTDCFFLLRHKSTQVSCSYFRKGLPILNLEWVMYMLFLNAYRTDIVINWCYNTFF